VVIPDRTNAFRLFFSLKGSVLPRIAPGLVACTALATLVTLSHGLLFTWKVTLTPVPFTLIGLAWRSSWAFATARPTSGSGRRASSGGS
jgi:putative membrane protein